MPDSAGYPTAEELVIDRTPEATPTQDPPAEAPPEEPAPETAPEIDQDRCATPAELAVMVAMLSKPAPSLEPVEVRVARAAGEADGFERGRKRTLAQIRETLPKALRRAMVDLLRSGDLARILDLVRDEGRSHPGISMVPERYLAATGTARVLIEEVEGTLEALYRAEPRVLATT